MQREIFTRRVRHFLFGDCPDSGTFLFLPLSPLEIPEKTSILVRE
jgi:hypothetical protein